MRVFHWMRKEGASVRLELTAEHAPEWRDIHEVHVLGAASGAGEE